MKHRALWAALGSVQCLFLGLGASPRVSVPAALLICLFLPARMKRRGTFPWGAMWASTVSRISWSASLSRRASASTSSAWVSTALRGQGSAGGLGRLGPCSRSPAGTQPRQRLRERLGKGFNIPFLPSARERGRRCVEGWPALHRSGAASADTERGRGVWGTWLSLVGQTRRAPGGGEG